MLYTYKTHINIKYFIIQMKKRQKHVEHGFTSKNIHKYNGLHAYKYAYMYKLSLEG